MKITICYDSCWRNSFLDGDNNESVPKKGRKYIASMISLKDEKNFLKREITKDTIMGILNRLIGDQKKLYQSRKGDNYYFKDIESKVSCKDSPLLTQEMTYLRNISGSTDQNSFTGSIKYNDVMFNSDYSKEFFGVLALNIDELLDFIINDNFVINDISLDPITIINRLEFLKKERTIKNNDNFIKAFQIFESHFKNDRILSKKDIFSENYLNAKKEIIVISLYASALYLQLEKLSKKYNMDNVKTKVGGISGISKRGFTKKDFMNRFTSGDKKIIFGNPYIYETIVKGEGKTKNLMIKASGKLDIILNISRDRAQEIRDMINNAGVSSFYLGKKGLAFVDGEINIREVSK
ncbi:hypothetical protein [uncultured Gammaproteobacteria bacterium]|nr:FIG00921294: hypothetical protein [uncultured Gammaproteobacteria bacterium]CAC9617587.1 hypothetical protein [uncultured Gammaproteobacteria bacterium]CAC9965212.1 FIG00921294: hypothetical protein [uncultured Gammaproteobacteria bacterium]